MDITIEFPGGKRVDAHVGDFVVPTDQPRHLGGGESAPAPYDLFLASIGTCAGIYVAGFCQARGISLSGISLVEHVDVDSATGLPDRIRLDLILPPDFPDKYRAAVVRAAEGCKVKKTLSRPPSIDVTAIVESRAA